MSSFDLEQFLLSNNFSKVTATSQGYMACCPFPEHSDSNPSWAIYDIYPYHFKCFACGRSGNLRSLKNTLSLVGNIPGEYTPLEEKDTKDLLFLKSRIASFDFDIIRDITGNILPYDFTSILHTPDSEKYIEYLSYRGVHDEIISHYDDYLFGASALYPEYMIIPLSVDGAVRYWSARSIDIQCPKALRFIFPVCLENALGKSAYIYSPRMAVNTREGCVTEGVFDTIKLISFGFNSVATFNAEPSREQVRQIISKFDIINIWYDNDSAGHVGTSTLIELLKPFGVVVNRVIPSAGKDAGDYISPAQALYDYDHKKSVYL